MKKLLTLLLILPFMIACSDDKEKEDKQAKAKKELIGTLWETDSYEVSGGMIDKRTIRFVDDNKCLLTHTRYNEGVLEIDSSEESIYGFDRENIWVAFNNIPYIGTISENRMTLRGMIELIYTKVE